LQQNKIIVKPHPADVLDFEELGTPEKNKANLPPHEGISLRMYLFEEDNQHIMAEGNEERIN
jgi:hypothetical protein